jgi:hypothetical protein
MTSSVSDLELAQQQHHHHHHHQQQQQQHQYSLNRYYQTKKSATNCNLANGTSGASALNNNSHLSAKYISNSQSTGDLSAIFGRAWCVFSYIKGEKLTLPVRSAKKAPPDYRQKPIVE